MLIGEKEPCCWRVFDGCNPNCECTSRKQPADYPVRQIDLGPLSLRNCPRISPSPMCQDALRMRGRQCWGWRSRGSRGQAGWRDATLRQRRWIANGKLDRDLGWSRSGQSQARCGSGEDSEGAIAWSAEDCPASLLSRHLDANGSRVGGGS
jgi:hypothetical protein